LSAAAEVYSLVVQTSFLGDMVLTTPLIASLASRGIVDVVATPASAPLLQNNPSVRELIVYDKRGAERGAAGFLGTSSRLRAARRSAFEERPVSAATAYLAQGSLRSAALATAAGFGERVGFDSSSGRRLYTRTVPYRADRHHAERLWSLATDDDAPPPAESLRPRLYPGPAEHAVVDALLGSPDAGSAPLVALAPGSVWATKRWPYYADLARLLTPHARIAVVGGADDRALAAEIVTAAGASTIDATGRLSLLASAELISRATTLVTNDSAPQHLASAVGTRTITMFGPTVPDFGFGPLAPGSLTPGHELLDCRPCDRHGPRRCPLGHWRCMREMPATLVAELVLRDVLPTAS
jgi:heptosyltransferase-2